MIKSPLSHNIFSKDLFKFNSIKDIWYILRILKNYSYLLKKRRKAKFLHEFPDYSAIDIALRFLLDHEEITSVVLGTCSVDHLHKNLEVSDHQSLSDYLVKKIHNL